VQRFVERGQGKKKKGKGGRATVFWKNYEKSFLTERQGEQRRKREPECDDEGGQPIFDRGGGGGFPRVEIRERAYLEKEKW